jgi:hypothetical protein
MFIAVINENFEIAEEAKRSQQVGHYFQATQGPDKTWGPWINRLNPYRWFKPSPRAIENPCGISQTSHLTYYNGCSLVMRNRTTYLLPL